MRSQWIMVNPNPIISILKKTIQAQKTEGRSPCDDKDYSDAVSSQGTPRTAGNPRQLEAARRESSLAF